MGKTQQTLPEVRRAIRNWVSLKPYIYMPLRRLRWPATTVGKGTDLLVEGYPRSGNSYTVFALLESQANRITIAHHAHAAAHVMAAVKLNVPALILLRHPADAIISFAGLVHGAIRTDMLLKEYILFHKNIVPLVQQIASVELEVVTRDFGNFLEALSRRYPQLGLVIEKGELETIQSRALSALERYNRDVRGKSGTRSNPFRDRTAEMQYRRKAAKEMQHEALRWKLKEAEKLFQDILDASSILKR